MTTSLARVLFAAVNVALFSSCGESQGPTKQQLAEAVQTTLPGHLGYQVSEVEYSETSDETTMARFKGELVIKEDLYSPVSPPPEVFEDAVDEVVLPLIRKEYSEGDRLSAYGKASAEKYGKDWRIIKTMLEERPPGERPLSAFRRAHIAGSPEAAAEINRLVRQNAEAKAARIEKEKRKAQELAEQEAQKAKELAEQQRLEQERRAKDKATFLASLETGAIFQGSFGGEVITMEVLKAPNPQGGGVEVEFANGRDLKPKSRFSGGIIWNEEEPLRSVLTIKALGEGVPTRAVHVFYWLPDASATLTGRDDGWVGEGQGLSRTSRAPIEMQRLKQ